MQDTLQIAKKTEELRGLMEKHLGIRGKTFAAALTRAGRSLPRAQRTNAQRITQAQEMAAHPMLSRRIDGPALERSYQDMRDWLRGHDLAEARKTRRIRLLAGIVGNLLLAAVLLGLLLYWRSLL